MKYCKKCVMPDTRPGIWFDEEGVCQACRAEEEKDRIDWNVRFETIKKICSKYKGIDNDEYNCIIAVSGGKDSHYQAYVMKELIGMHLC